MRVHADCFSPAADLSLCSLIQEGPMTDATPPQQLGRSI
ncbi:hypothetical protein SynNOUM97013_01763 [Synechococcus sp. NOUM97013]|nr:hypothetical protein SynNOUM97013_01763 [Synechococcus sp. NOUM97013]